jgi:hypothetical protein
MDSDQKALLNALRGENKRNPATPVDQTKPEDEKPEDDPRIEEEDADEEIEEEESDSGEEESGEEEQGDEETPDRFDSLEQENLELRRKLAEFEATLKNLQNQPQEQTEQQQQSTEEAAEAVELEDIWTEEQIEQAYENPASFVKALNEGVKKIYKRVRADLDKETSQALQKVHKDVQNTVNASINVRRTVDDFYSRNPDFVPIKGYVGTTMQNLAQENPNLGLDELLQKTEEVVRTNMKLEKREETPKPSGQPRKTRARVKNGDDSSLTPVQKEIRAMRRHRANS